MKAVSEMVADGPPSLALDHHLPPKRLQRKYAHALSGELVAVVSIVYYEQGVPAPGYPPVRAPGVHGVYASLGACSARARRLVPLPAGTCATALSLTVDPAAALRSRAAPRCPQDSTRRSDEFPGKNYSFALASQFPTHWCPSYSLPLLQSELARSGNDGSNDLEEVRRNPRRELASVPRSTALVRSDPLEDTESPKTEPQSGVAKTKASGGMQFVSCAQKGCPKPA
ncbi:hypothetical protein FB451DRAFT_1175840 [Mycena latifolia]|nr:hypothetical protein FB451DRAFT_1175840 [Mycena latifolia]